MAAKAHETKSRIFAQFARVGAALGHAKRVEIVDVLLQGERTVESLAQQISASVANTSRHLQILSAAGLVSRRAAGNSRLYQLADESVASVYLALVGVAEGRIAEITTLADGLFAEIDGAKPVSFEELDRLSRSGEAILVDVRPAAEFAAGHLEGAINIPLAELDERIAELPADQDIIAYCRGAYCFMAAHAVARMRREGRVALRLDGGFSEWWESGRHIEEE